MTTRPTSKAGARLSSKTLIWTAVGAVTGLATLGWSIFNQYFAKHEKPPFVEQGAVAGQGGTAVNAAGTATISVGGATSPASTSASASPQPEASASQSALAASGGTALNATDAAHISIRKP